LQKLTRWEKAIYSVQTGLTLCEDLCGKIKVRWRVNAQSVEGIITVGHGVIHNVKYAAGVAWGLRLPRTAAVLKVTHPLLRKDTLPICPVTSAVQELR
jgi:hypothetical protein